MELEPVYSTIGGIIRQKRRRLELPQAELARRLGISRATLANIETGRQRILVHQLYSLAKALDMKHIDLLPPVDTSPQDGDWTQLPIPSDLKLQQKEQIAHMIGSFKQTKSPATETRVAQSAKTNNRRSRSKTA